MYQSGVFFQLHLYKKWIKFKYFHLIYPFIFSHWSKYPNIVVHKSYSLPPKTTKNDLICKKIKRKRTSFFLYEMDMSMFIQHILWPILVSNLYLPHIKQGIVQNHSNDEKTENITRLTSSRSISLCWSSNFRTYHISNKAMSKIIWTTTHSHPPTHPKKKIMIDSLG